MSIKAPLLNYEFITLHKIIKLYYTEENKK